MSAPLSPTPQLQAGGGQTALHASMNTLSILSPTVQKYLKLIADGQTPFAAQQLAEYSKFLLERLRLEEKPKQHGRLDFQSLVSYMGSSESNALRPAGEVDLNYPIASYFISSSHNTYLSGNQLYGGSSAEAYRNVRKKIALL